MIKLMPETKHKSRNKDETAKTNIPSQKNLDCCVPRSTSHATRVVLHSVENNFSETNRQQSYCWKHNIGAAATTLREAGVRTYLLSRAANCILSLASAKSNNFILKFYLYVTIRK